MCADLDISSELANNVFMNLAAGYGESFVILTADDVDIFLNKLMPIAKLDGYWIETFLSAVSKTQGARLSKFFMDRVNHAAAKGAGTTGRATARMAISPCASGSLRTSASCFARCRNG